MKIQLFPLESNYEIHRIARQNNENHEHLIITHHNNENNEIHRISLQNHENLENLIILC